VVSKSQASRFLSPVRIDRRLRRRPAGLLFQPTAESPVPDVAAELLSRTGPGCIFVRPTGVGSTSSAPWPGRTSRPGTRVVAAPGIAAPCRRSRGPSSSPWQSTRPADNPQAAREPATACSDSACTRMGAFTPAKILMLGHLPPPTRHAEELTNATSFTARYARACRQLDRVRADRRRPSLFRAGWTLRPNLRNSRAASLPVRS
jgi:hypothetical protein